MKLRTERQFSNIIKMAERYLLRWQIRSYEPYHPLFVQSEQWAEGERACSDRWVTILPYLKKLSPSSLLDLGCAEGYFVQQAASTLHCLSLGVDADIRRLTVARALTTLNETVGASFVQSDIDLAFLEKLPRFDVVIFLSVLHHVMYEHGENYARTLMTSIHGLTGKCLVFDMGQSTETSHAWSKLLPNMLPDAATWITNFLKSAGFTTIEIAGDTDAYKSDERRHLFIAVP